MRLPLKLQQLGSFALVVGVDRIIVTAGSLPEAKSALALAKTHGKRSKHC